MRKLLPLAVFALPLTVPMLGCNAARAQDTTTLTTIADARSGIATPVDLGPAGDSPGDMFVFDQPLLNAAGQNIGSNSGYCVRTLPGQFSECQWTLTMTDGTITVAGREAEQGTSLIPILGGTGAFVGVRGMLSTTPNGDKTFTQVLTLIPATP